MGVSSEKLWHEVIAGSMLQANNSEILPQEETEEYFIRAEYRASEGHVRKQEDEEREYARRHRHTRHFQPPVNTSRSTDYAGLIPSQRRRMIFKNTTSTTVSSGFLPPGSRTSAVLPEVNQLCT
jgi:hypothetical protein